MTRTTLMLSVCLMTGGAIPAWSGTVYANGTGTFHRGDDTVGSLAGFYGGDSFLFPVPLDEVDARFAVVGAPDDFYLSLPGRDDTPVGTGFRYTYIEVTFPTTFLASGSTLTLYEVGDNAERALIWLWVEGGGFIHANADVRTDGYVIDLSPLQSLLDTFGPGAVFTKVGIGGLDSGGGSEGFDLDSVTLTTLDVTGPGGPEVPEPATLLSLGAGLIVLGIARRQRAAAGK
jgi:PEP-CTERM motif